MCEANRLDQILIRAKGTRQRPTDLSHFQRVGEAGPEVIPFEVDKHLSLVFEPSKCRRVQDAVAVALERCAVFRFSIQIGASLRVLTPHSVRSQAFVLDLFKLLTSEKHSQPFRCKRHCEPSESNLSRGDCPPPMNGGSQ